MGCEPSSSSHLGVGVADDNRPRGGGGGGGGGSISSTISSSASSSNSKSYKSSGGSSCVTTDVFDSGNPAYELLNHGIFRERQAEMVTDAMRALLLDLAGYDTR